MKNPNELYVRHDSRFRYPLFLCRRGDRARGKVPPAAVAFCFDELWADMIVAAVNSYTCAEPERRRRRKARK